MYHSSAQIGFESKIFYEHILFLFRNRRKEADPLYFCLLHSTNIFPQTVINRLNKWGFFFTKDRNVVLHCIVMYIIKKQKSRLLLNIYRIKEKINGKKSHRSVSLYSVLVKIQYLVYFYSTDLLCNLYGLKQLLAYDGIFFQCTLNTL